MIRLALITLGIILALVRPVIALELNLPTNARKAIAN